MILSILNEKGGCGKSTVATNVACALHTGGARVLLVDADRQGTAQDWAAARPDDTDAPTVIGLPTPKLDTEVQRMSGDYDHVVIDTAGVLDKVSVAALKAADVVVIPVAPSAADIWAALDVVDLVEQRQNVTRGRPVARFLVWNGKVGTRLTGEADEALASLDVPVMEARAHNREAFKRAMGEGRSVLDLAPDSKAAAEVRAVADELHSLTPSSVSA